MFWCCMWFCCCCLCCCLLCPTDRRGIAHVSLYSLYTILWYTTIQLQHNSLHRISGLWGEPLNIWVCKKHLVLLWYLIFIMKVCNENKDIFLVFNYHYSLFHQWFWWDVLKTFLLKNGQGNDRVQPDPLFLCCFLQVFWVPETSSNYESELFIEKSIL